MLLATTICTGIELTMVNKNPRLVPHCHNYREPRTHRFDLHAGLAIGMLMTCAGGPASLSFEYPCRVYTRQYEKSKSLVKLKPHRPRPEIADKSRRFTEKPCYFFPEHTVPRVFHPSPDPTWLLLRMIDAIVIDEINNASSNATQSKRTRR